MTDQEIIVKAEAALKAVELNFDDETIASVSRNHDKLVLKEMPELDNEYFVHFSKKGIDGRKTGFTVIVEKKQIN